MLPTNGSVTFAACLAARGGSSRDWQAHECAAVCMVADVRDLWWRLGQLFKCKWGTSMNGPRRRFRRTLLELVRLESPLPSSEVVRERHVAPVRRMRFNG